MPESQGKQQQQQQSQQQEATVARNEARVDDKQVKPAADRPQADLKADLTNPQDADLGVLQEPEHDADKTSLPTAYAPIDRPPVSTPRHDEPVLQSLVTGAGAHTPPDPDVYDAAGRVRDDQ